MRIALAFVGLALIAGCSQPQIDEPAAKDESLFGPASMRVHPIFTELKDWDSDGKLDGIEVLVEFNDQFGDPTKAAGTVMFELFRYRQAEPEPRGPRVVNPWFGSTMTEADQRARWNRTSRTYTFQLAWPQVRTDENYVLTATFRSATEGRFFDRVILAAQEPAVAPIIAPATQPATQP